MKIKNKIPINDIKKKIFKKLINHQYPLREKLKKKNKKKKKKEKKKET